MQETRTGKAGWTLGLLTIGDLVQQTGMHFQTVAIAAFTYGMTGSAWAYALQQTLAYLPWMLFPGIAGPIVDRLDCRKVMIASGLLRGIVYFWYPYCHSLEPILVITFLGSACGVFIVTARTALIPTLTGKEGLLKVNGLRTAAFGCVDLLMPALAGVLQEYLGTTVAFRIVASAMVLGAAWFATIPPAPRRELAGNPGEWQSRKRHLGRDLADAVLFIRRDPTLVLSIAVFTVYVSGQSGTNALFYPFVDSILKKGPEVFGLSISFYFGANLLAGLLLARFGAHVQHIRAAALSLLPASMWLLYPVVRSVPLILAMGFVEGMVVSLVSTLHMTELQAASPQGMTGRVWGVASSVNGGGQVLGILLLGAVAGQYGTLTAYKTSAVLVVTLIVLLEIIRSRRR